MSKITALIETGHRVRRGVLRWYVPRREQPSTAFRSMPHYTTYGGSYLSALPVDELTGKFDALNETNNFRPSKGESISVIHPQFRSSRTIDPEDGVNRANPTPHPGSHSDAVRADDIAWGNQGPVIYKALNETTNFRPAQSECISIVYPDLRTGLINPDSMRPIDFGDFEPRKSKSFEVTDLDFNDVLIGTFEDRHIGDYDANDAVVRGLEAPGAEIGVIHPSYKPEPRGYDPVPIDTLSKTFRDVDQRMIGSTSGEGVFKTETNGYWDWTGEPTPNDVYCGPHSCSSSFKTENFESMEAMTSFAGFFNHVPGGEGFQPREGASVEIGNPPEPKLWLQILG